ncbi:PleD family two-component system response regulator [Okeania sp. SIO1I7]|uniref:response regulator n=1 Tax=Okeania sp. SIO1I7 TaxID=2607772 RepID=UPI0013F863E8|nr:response regulator [Okeania sp. SIO1I7]NET27890.1 response regulator [Okeania sp. SIO1I7]
MIKKTVLIVDDCAIVRKLGSHILAKMGLNIILASNGLEALEKIKLESPDLVLLDIIMPKMNGYSVCRQIKSEPTIMNIPVIFCSSKNEEVDVYWAMKQGANGYISKPVKKYELMAIMARFNIIANVKNKYSYSDQFIYKQGCVRILSPEIESKSNSYKFCTT